jgi:hypothetical protein
MTPADLEAWRSRMGISVREACRQLDIAQDRWRRMMDGGRIPAHIGYACAALAFGLPQWRRA